MEPKPTSAPVPPTPVRHGSGTPWPFFLLALALNVVIGAIVGCLRPLPWLRYVPNLVDQTYRALRKTPRLGGNIKTVAFGGLVFLAATCWAWGPAAGAIYGGYRSARNTFRTEDGWPADAFKLTWADFAGFGRRLETELMAELSAYALRPLAPGEAPFDIFPIQFVEALFSAILGTIVNGVALLGLLLVHAWPLFWTNLRILWRGEIDLWVIIWKVVASAALAGATVVAGISLWIGWTLYTPWTHVKRGYRLGLATAWKSLWLELRLTHGRLKLWRLGWRHEHKVERTPDECSERLSAQERQREQEGELAELLHPPSHTGR